MNKVKNYIMLLIAILMAFWIASTIFYSIKDLRTEHTIVEYSSETIPLYPE
jgi:hypothetical protein